jgi:hypothetical protein
MDVVANDDFFPNFDGPPVPEPSILFDDLRIGGDEATIAANAQEVAVGNPDGIGGPANDYVHPVVIVPDLADLHIAQVDWRTKSLDYLFSDEIVQCLTFTAFHLVFGLLALLFVRHRSPPRLKMKIGSDKAFARRPSLHNDPVAVFRNWQGTGEELEGRVAVKNLFSKPGYLDYSGIFSLELNNSRLCGFARHCGREKPWYNQL